MRVPIGVSAYSRTFDNGPEILLINRYFEKDPKNQTDQVSLLSRPGSTAEYSPGIGPIRQNFSLPNLLGGDLFTVSNDAFFRHAADGTDTTITGTIAQTATPEMAGVSGAGYERIFIADGETAQYYGGPAYQAVLTLTPGGIHDDVVTIDGVVYKFSYKIDAASGILAVSGTIADDKVTIDTKVYQFVAAPAGSHAGTAGDPWQVKVNGSNTAALVNLVKAINATGVAGTDYDSGVTAHPTVAADYSTSVNMGVHARTAGTGGNAIVTTTTAVGGSDGLTWGAATLTGGQSASTGLVANPHHVFINGSDANALANLRKAINASGTPGTDYSAAKITADPRVFSNANTSLTLTVRGLIAGALDPVANVSITNAGASDGLAWDNSLLVAGPHVLYGIATPDDVGMVDVAIIDSFVLWLKAGSQRIYYTLPGEVTIDGLNFFEAEGEPDQVVNIKVVGDRILLIGQGSTEQWFLSGDATAPFQRVAGAGLSIGGIQGTAVSLNDKVFMVGSDYSVYRVGDPTPISTPAIAELIRKAAEIERANS